MKPPEKRGNEPVLETPTRAPWRSRSTRQPRRTEYQRDAERPWQNEALLGELYVTQRFNTYEIADRFDCHSSTVREWLDRFDVPRRGPNGSPQDVNYKNRSWLEKHGIERRAAASEVDEDAPYTDREWLEIEYTEAGRSSSEIAEEVGVHAATVRTWLHRHGISVRNEGRPRLAHAAYFLDSSGDAAWRDYDPDERREVYVAVHRLLAVAVFGVHEMDSKHVHHRNGVKWDNHPANLELRTPTDHAKHHAEQQDRDRDAFGRFK